MAHVRILMGVYEGQAHLDAQLQSLFDQDHDDWSLVVSDDSPTAASRDLTEAAFAAHPDARLDWLEGPKAGFAANYMSLLCREAPDSFLALADQDDVWLPDKLSRGLAALAEGPGDVPALYCARSFLWDGADARRPSPLFPRPPGFANALIENVAQGNTVLLNPAAMRLARQAGAGVAQVFAHDWWLYQLISGAGGRVIADNGPPVMLYRQHAGNQIGAGAGLRAQARRKRSVLGGAFSARLDLNAAALRACADWLTPENAALLERFEAARRAPLPRRLAELARMGVYRQRRAGNIGFWGASVLGRA